MLVYLVQLCQAAWPGDSLAGANSLGLRALLAAIVSFVSVLLCGPRAIRWLGKRFRERVRIDAPDVARLHAAKQATPTMGGLLILGAIAASLGVFGDWRNPYLPIALLTIVLLGTLGAIDDLTKSITARRGLPARAKLIGQLAIALTVSLLVFSVHRRTPNGLALAVPFHTEPIELGCWFVPLAVLVIVSASNAVNLTDGLDGLAGGCLVCTLVAFLPLVAICGSWSWAHDLGVAYVPSGGEMAVVAAATIGALLGFLRFNRHPASVFMGDTGSLPLGGLVGLLAVVARQELLLIAIAGVFVAEAASVLVQVAVYRATRHRVFRCAPLHHHFQLLGWPEPTIVLRFWIAAALCAAVSLGSMLNLAGRQGLRRLASTEQSEWQIDFQRSSIANFERTNGDNIASNPRDTDTNAIRP